MSEEKQIAIQNLEKYIKVDPIYNGSRENLSDFDEFCINHCTDIQIVLELIREQQKEIKEKNETIDSLERDIGEYVLEKEKQDKIIDLMAEQLNKNGDWYFKTKEDFKEYYREKVEND